MPTDRHARARRADGDPRRRPVDGFRTRDRRRFRDLLHEAVSTLPQEAVAALGDASIVVHDVPAADSGAVPLAEAEAAQGGLTVDRIVVYRRPTELRATDRDDLVELVRDAVLEAVADAVGADPDEWDED